MNNSGGSGNPFDPNGNLPRYGETNHPEDGLSFGQQGAGGYAGYQAAGGPYQAPSDPTFPTGSFADRSEGQVSWKEAIKYGFKTTAAKPGLWVLGTFLVFIIPIAVVGISAILTSDADAGTGAKVLIFLKNGLLIFPVAFLVLTPFILRLCLHEVDTGKATWGDLKNNVHTIPTIVVKIISGLITFAFSLQLVLPAAALLAPAAVPVVTQFDELTSSETLDPDVVLIILSAIIGLIFLARITNGLIQPLFDFMAWYAVSGQAGIGSAIKEGFRIGRANYVQLLIFGFIMGFIGTLGVIFTFGLGLLVILPASCLSQAHLFRQMAGNVPVNKG